MKKRKRFIRKQSTYKTNVRQNRTIHHQLTIKKVNDFRVLSDEGQFNRNKSNIVLNPKFLSILTKLKCQKKVKLLSIDTEEEINKYKTDLYTILLYHIRSLNEIEFISTYNTNKSMLDVNQQDSEMNTLLIYATKYNCYKICEYLLSNQCDPNIQNSFGNTALHYLCSKPECIQLAEKILEAGGNPNIYNDANMTPLYSMVADMNGNYINSGAKYEMIELLLKYGADKTLKCVDGNTSMDVAEISVTC